MISLLRILIREDVLTFIIGLSLFIFIFCTIINTASTDDLYQDTVSPVNIYTKGNPDEPFFIGVIMKEGSDNAVLLINQWENAENQSDYLISFTSPVRDIDVALQRKPGGEGNRTRVLEFAQRRQVPYSKIYPGIVSSNLSTLHIRPAEIPNYYGVACNIDGIVHKVSAYQKTVSLPLKIDPNKQIDGYRPIRTVIVQVVPPSGYTVQNAMPEAVLFSLIGEHFAANEFSIDTMKTDLFVLYENRATERDLRILEIILGMMLSLATYFLATGFIKMISPLNLSVFGDSKEQKSFMVLSQGRRYQRILRRRMR